jgi:hypothetical protein
MCDLICVEVIPRATLEGCLGDVMIGHTKCHGQKREAFFDYPSFDNYFSLSLLESVHEARDEKYGTTIANTNKLKFMCSSPNNSNNIMWNRKRDGSHLSKCNY